MSIARMVGAVAFAAVVVAACSSDSSEPEVAIDSFADVLIESTWLGDPSFAIDTAMAECMRESGYAVVVEPMPEPDEARAGQSLPDDEYVARYGYGLVEQPATEVQAPPSLEENSFQRAWLDLPLDERPGFAIAYGGSADPATPVAGAGCAGAVVGVLDDPESGFFETVELLEDFQRRVSADDRVVQARGEWSRCMSEAGFPGLVDTAGVFNDLFTRLQEPGADREELRQFELSIAAADFACLKKTFEVTSMVEAELAPLFAEEAAKLLLADD